jgi:hypothetical protein
MLPKKMLKVLQSMATQKDRKNWRKKIIIKKNYKLGWLVNLFYIIAHIEHRFNLKDE